jgi:hypothetical protein
MCTLVKQIVLRLKKQNCDVNNSEMKMNIKQFKYLSLIYMTIVLVENRPYEKPHRRLGHQFLRDLVPNQLFVLTQE